MGNQEIRRALAKVTKSDFTEAGAISDKYLTQAIQGGVTDQDIGAFLQLISAENLAPDSKQFLSDTMKKCFPQNSSITFDTSEPEERWNQQARELWQSGFTSWQHNLNAIQSDQNNRVVLSQNRSAAEYEFQFYARCLMLGSNYMLRHVGGEEIKDFQTYFREKFEQSSSEYVFNTMAQSALLAMLSSVTNLTAYPEHMTDTLDAMIMATQGVQDGSLFKMTDIGMQLDLLLKRIRKVIQGIIESSESPKDIKTKCAELLLRIGIIAGNPEDLILAAHYQFIHKIDISKHLGFFLKPKFEIFEEPQSAVKQEFKLQEAKKRISGRVSYANKREDKHTECTKFACDGTYFYSFDNGKGLSRALKTADGDWQIEQLNESDDIKNLECVSFLTHKGELYIRHSGLTEEPFKLINKATLTIDSNAPVIKASEGQQFKFRWTTDQTVEISNEGKRWMNAAPMASNGRYIYTLVQYRKDDVNSERISTFCEWYELKDNELNFVSEIKLTDENDIPWIGNKFSSSAQVGGYFDRGMIACNGNLLVWHAKHNVHIFDLKTGKRQKRFDVHGGSNYLTCYDSVTSNFYSGDASVYSYWDVWKISGFMTIEENEEEEKKVDYKLPTIPVVLEDPKKKIIEKNKSMHRKQTDFQLNLFSSLIGGQFENEAKRQPYHMQIENAPQQQDEEQPDGDKQPDLTENGWIYEYTRAIILSYVSFQAQSKNFYAQNTGDVHLKGSDALTFFKEKHCISISESTLKSLRYSLEEVLQNYDCLEAKISQRSSLKSLLHIYIAHIACLRPLKLSLKQILSKEELENQKKLIEQISKIGLIEGQNQHPAETEELSDEHCFQLHIYHMSKQVHSQTSSLLSSKTIGEKLDSMLDTLEAFKKQPESTFSDSLIQHLRRFQGAAEFVEVFEDDKSVLEKMKLIFDEISSLIKEGLVKKVSDMLEDKSKIEDNFKGFGSQQTFELVQFNFKFIREALVYYVNQVKAIQESEPTIERCNQGHDLKLQFGSPYSGGAARCDRCREMVQDVDRGFFRCRTCNYDCCNNCVPRSDTSSESKARQQKKIALTKEGIKRKEKFNEFFYNYMIKACENCKEILRDFSSLILKSAYENFDEDALQEVFKKIQALLFGLNSPLSAIQMFVMTIQLYEVDSTDLDEVSEALRNAVEGLNLYLGSRTTLHYRKPEIKEANKKVVDDFSQAHRLISFGLSKVAARLVNGKNNNGQNDSLAKFKIFEKGIAQRHIPLLSDNCKKEIEGSFKITGDAKCRELALAKRKNVQYSQDYKQLRMILSEIDDSQNPDQFAQTKTLMSILRSQATESDQEENQNVENLVLHTFATLLLFEDLTENFNQAIQTASSDSNYTFDPEDPILKAYTEACKMRDWMRKRKESLQIELKLQVTEEFKKDYSQNNSDSPPLVELSIDDQKEVDNKVGELLVRELEKTVDNAIKKCDLLLLYETEVEEVQIDLTGIVENNRESNWSAWQPTPVQKRPQVEISEEDLQKHVIERVELEIFQVLQGDFSSESLQEFIELSQIKGLRRLAGLVMLNKTLSSSDSTVFYDTLHMWEASLRENQSKISHYLAGVQGCGATTSKSIRDQFFEGVRIIIEKLKQENDSQRIVQLLNSLIWDYAPSDLEFIAKLSVFDVLSGENPFCKFNQIYCAWGQEKYHYSIENLDRSLDTINRLQYSLSARLRQTFDFLAFKVYSVVYKADEKFHHKNNSKLKTIGTILMQEIADICRDKLNQHLKMLENTPLKAASERDQEIRFETLSGEVPDSSDSYMVDQCLAFQGKDCIAAIKKKRDEVYEKLSIKRLNSFIYQLKKANFSQQLGDLIARNFGLSDADDYEAVVDSIISRDWRVINFLMDSEINANLAVEEDFNNNLEGDSADEQEEEDNILKKIKDSVKEVADEKEKLDQWLIKLKESECKQSPLSQAKLFSQASIFGFVNMLALLFSLSESSQKSADFLKQVIDQGHVTTLLQVSVLCSSPIQCLVQRIFQSMIRLSMPKNYLDNAVTAAKSDNQSNIIKTIAEVRTCIDMQSSFWQLLYNQIEMTKQAQFNNTDQVELGKPAVVEEITRTFLTIRQKKGENSDMIIKQVENAVFEIEKRTIAEFSALFQLVPSSHLPFVTTGKRCKDAASEESFICLGYVKNNVTTTYKTAISLMPLPDSQIIGLLVSQDGSAKIQVQKSFNVTNLVELHDVESSEIFDNLSEAEKKDFTKEMAQQSPYMNPEIVTKLFNRIIQKDSFIRQNPSSAIEHQLFQTFIQRGIFRMIQIFDDAYLYMLKQFSLLEALINFLSKEAAQQIFKPSEPLVSYEILMQLLNQVFVSATHTNRSAGKYSKLLLYINQLDTKAAFLQRMADGENSAEFLNIEIVYTCGDQGRTIPSKCTTSEDHQLTNQFGDAQSDTMEDLKCGMCKDYINLTEKVKQKKTGLLKCMECSNSECYFCNQCFPKPQLNTDYGLEVGIYSECFFRIARHEAILINSEKLATLHEEILGTILMSNVVITDDKVPLLTIFEALAEKIISDKRWKECALTRFVVVKEVSFNRAKEFLAGEKISGLENTRGQMLTKICQYVDVARDAINDPKRAKNLVCDFLSNLDAKGDEFLQSQVPEILGKYFGEAAEEGDLAKEKEQEKLKKQLQCMSEEKKPASKAAENFYSSTKDDENRNSNTTPNFMNKFTSESKKIIEEGGEEFFKPFRTNEQSEFQRYYDSIVFETTNENPDQLQRAQLGSMNKINQILARSIWLQVISNESYCQDIEAKNLFNTEAMHKKIFDLLHESNMAASHQRIFMGAKLAQNDIREQISRVLKFFDTLPDGEKFRISFIQDLIVRADLTIDQIKKDQYQELQNYCVKDLRKLSKLHNVLDPCNLIFLSKEIFSNQNYLGPQQKQDMAKMLFDLHLGYAIIFKSQDDYSISQDLIKGCSWTLDILLSNLDEFLIKPNDVNSILEGDLLKELFDFMNKSTEVSSKRKQLTEIIIKLSLIFQKNQQRNRENAAIQTPFVRTDHVVNMIQAYKNLSQGRSFASQISRIKLMALLRTRYAGQVRKYGETYQTDSQMYKTHFKKIYCNIEQDVLFSVDFTSSNCALKIENTTSKKQLLVDKKLFKLGINQMRVPKGETVVVEFPAELSSTKMSGYLRNRISGQYLTIEDYQEIEGLMISASQVYAHNQHVMFIDQQSQVMGIGIGPIENGVDESNKIKMIDRPVNCQGPYLKATTGKYFRLLLTEQNKLFINGRCKQFVAGPVDVNAYVKGFHEITNIYPLSQDEKIVDVAGGRNFIIVVTDKGGIYASGSELYRPVEQQVPIKQDQVTAPYKITMQQGWQATKCWANDLYYNFWVLAEKIGDSNVKKTFSLGADYDMVGAADSSGAPNWREPAFPENTYMKSISSRGMFALGIDQDNNVWEWGSHGNNKEEFYVKAREDLPTGRSTPVKFVVFQNHGKTPIRAVCCQQDTAMFLTKDNTTGDHEIYGYSGNAKNGMFGQNVTDAFDCGNFVLINKDNISHSDIVDFAATRYSSYIITRKDVKQLPSIFEDQPQNRDLIHFYKDKKGGWNFVTQKDYEAKKISLPKICFATRHPIKDFQIIKEEPSCLPNLDLILKNEKFGTINNNPFPNITTTLSNKPIAKGSSLYYAKYDLDGEQYELYASHEEASEGGNVFDMTPIIFYVIKPSIAVEPSQLEMIDYKKLFTKSDQDNEELRFSVTNLNLDAEEILRIPSPTPEFASKIYNLQNFDLMQDIELIKAIDFQRQTEFKNAKIEILKDVQFDPKKFALANNSPLRDLDNELLVQRTCLLIQFSQAVSTLIPSTFFEVSVDKNSIPNQIKMNRDLILPSLKRLLFKNHLKEYISFRNIDIKNPLRYNRKMALEFEQQGIKNNPDFIKCSTFGQFFSQSLLSSPDFEMFQNNDNAPLSNEWIDGFHPNDIQEDQTQFIYRQMEKDLMSGMIPLFIQCPNGRLRCGLMRDSFRVNPKAILNKYMKCYQFIGSYIARAMWRDFLWFGVTMAPTFWMILNDEEPKLQDFADEDARLQKRLNKFQSAEYENWPSDEFWVWQDCEDKILPLEKGGELKQVTRGNFEEFEQALLKMLINEGQKQMSLIKKGMSISLGEMDFFRQFINWHDMMIMVESIYEADGKEDRKLSNYQNIQNIKDATIYINCDENNDQIVRFWNIYKDLNPEDMKIFFNFVGGRTRIGDVPHRFHKKLTIRVDSSIPAGEGPKSLPHQFELVLPETYESEDVFRAALFESMNKGIGLECDPE